mmetsp:Transcript_12985/g.31016  ORF Transcript_12985/g.31016 Transcript_12985/m.31016 type:complete len:285 (+) Transcript_12985:1903-2757(+)
MYLAYMSSTFSRSTSAFHSSWSRALVTALVLALTPLLLPDRRVGDEGPSTLLLEGRDEPTPTLSSSPSVLAVSASVSLALWCCAGGAPLPPPLAVRNATRSFLACCSSLVTSSASCVILKDSISSSSIADTSSYTLAYAGPTPASTEMSSSGCPALWRSMRHICPCTIFRRSDRRSSFFSSWSGVLDAISMHSSSVSWPLSLTSGSCESLMLTSFFSNARLNRLECCSSCSLDISFPLARYISALSPVTQWSNSNSSLHVRSSVLDACGPYITENERCSSRGSL